MLEIEYFQKTMDFRLLLKIWVEILVKNVSKILSSKYC